MRRKWAKSFYFADAGYNSLVTPESEVQMSALLWTWTRGFLETIHRSLHSIILKWCYYQYMDDFIYTSQYSHLNMLPMIPSPQNTQSPLNICSHIYWAYRRNSYTHSLTASLFWQISKGRPYSLLLSSSAIIRCVTSFYPFRHFQARRNWFMHALKNFLALRSSRCSLSNLYS